MRQRGDRKRGQNRGPASHLHQEGPLLLSRLPPDLRDLVDLRIEKAVLGPVRFHVVLEKRAKHLRTCTINISLVLTLKWAANTSFL